MRDPRLLYQSESVKTINIFNRFNFFQILFSHLKMKKNTLKMCLYPLSLLVDVYWSAEYIIVSFSLILSVEHSLNTSYLPILLIYLLGFRFWSSSQARDDWRLSCWSLRFFCDRSLVFHNIPDVITASVTFGWASWGDELLKWVGDEEEDALLLSRCEKNQKNNSDRPPKEAGRRGVLKLRAVEGFKQVKWFFFSFW